MKPKKKGKYHGMVIGCGTIGARWDADPGRVVPKTHAGAFVHGSRTELAALVDADESRLRDAGKLFPKARLYKDAEVALRTEKPDIVVIATPPKTHVALVRLACRANVKMIICEKPLAPSAREAVALAPALKKFKGVFIVNYQRRFFELFENLRREIAAGALGRIQQVTAYYDNGLNNTGGHALDATLFLLGDRVEKASGLLNTMVKKYPAGDPDIDGVLETTNGTRIVLQGLDKTAYGLWELHIFGTKGSVSINEHGYHFEWKVPTRRLKIPVLVGMKRQRQRESFVKGAHDEAIRCYEKRLKPRSNFMSGMEILAALDALKKSATQDGKAVRVRYTR